MPNLNLQSCTNCWYFFTSYHYYLCINRFISFLFLIQYTGYLMAKCFLTPLQNPLWDYVDLTFSKPSYWSKYRKLSSVENIMINNLNGLMKRFLPWDIAHVQCTAVCTHLYSLFFYFLLFSHCVEGKPTQYFLQIWHISCQLLSFLLHWIDFVKQQPW